MYESSCKDDEDLHDLHLEFPDSKKIFQKLLKPTLINSPCHIQQGSSKDSRKNIMTSTDRRESKSTSKLEMHISCSKQHQIIPNLYQNYHHSKIYAIGIMNWRIKEVEKPTSWWTELKSLASKPCHVSNLLQYASWDEWWWNGSSIMHEISWISNCHGCSTPWT